MNDYLTPDDVADSPDDEIPPDPPAEVRQVDRAFILGLAANLDAMRSMIDACLVVIDGILGDVEGGPVEVASCEVTGDDDCPHPRNRRQSLVTIGSGDDTPRWRCRDCGYTHDPPRRD